MHTRGRPTNTHAHTRTTERHACTHKADRLPHMHTRQTDRHAHKYHTRQADQHTCTHKANRTTYMHTQGRPTDTDAHTRQTDRHRCTHRTDRPTQMHMRAESSTSSIIRLACCSDNPVTRQLSWLCKKPIIKGMPGESHVCLSDARLTRPVGQLIREHCARAM